MRIQLEAHQESGLQVIQGICENLSAKGLYIVCQNKLPLYSSCKLALYLGDSRYQPAIHIQGKIVRVDERGMGLELEAMDLESFDLFKNIIVFSSSDPDRAEQEFKKFLGLKLR